MIGRLSGASRFNINTFSEVLELRGMEKVVSKRDDFVVDVLFYFERVQRFEYRGDKFSFWVPVSTGDEIFVFSVCLGKVGYNSLI